MSAIEKIKAKVENVIHPHGHSSTTGTTGTTGSHTNGTHTGTAHSGLPEGTAGPHSSRAANAADPRVDSDRDHRGATGTGIGSGTTGTTGTTQSGTAEGVAGPHNSRLANAADPRVDSDLDGRGATGNTGYNSGMTGGSTGTGYNSTGATGATTGGSTVGPHSSNLANKLDPRVDSTSTTNTGTTGYGGTHAGNNQGGFTGTSGGLSNSTNAGPHDSNLANKADPRVDSDLDGRGNRHGAATGASAGITGASGSHATPGSGTAQNTAGPHNSDTLNKLDPRVDSDRDGSNTVGGNRTHADTHDLDASKVPPSVFAAHKGEPEVVHGDHSHNYAGRHGGVVSNQNQLSGV